MAISIDEARLRIQAAFPRIYHACHTRHQTARATGQDLSPRDGAILAHLSEPEGLPQGLLAGHLGIAKSTLSEALKFLEKAGLVRREAEGTIRGGRGCGARRRAARRWRRVRC